VQIWPAVGSQMEKNTLNSNRHSVGKKGKRYLVDAREELPEMKQLKPPNSMSQCALHHWNDVNKGEWRVNAKFVSGGGNPEKKGYSDPVV